MQIAAADDPEQALEDEREKTRKAVAKNREKTKAELEAARMLVTSKPKADDEPTKPEPTKPSRGVRPVASPRPSQSPTPSSLRTMSANILSAPMPRRGWRVTA